ncbi:MAG: hypothetical protein GXX89_00755 [Clostridiales bacterium]|jgi:DNA-binding Xre family transcriptional regulator|nr:hypothetical protein [Clostridiales bacterium]
MAGTIKGAHNPEDILASLIAKNMRLYRIDKDDLAAEIRVSRTTLYNRLRRPSDFTFSELQLLFRALHFTQEDIVSLIKPLARRAS